MKLEDLRHGIAHSIQHKLLVNASLDVIEDGLPHRLWKGFL